MICALRSTAIGSIAAANTATGRAVVMTHDIATGKWHPYQTPPTGSLLGEQFLALLGHDDIALFRVFSSLSPAMILKTFIRYAIFFITRHTRLATASQCPLEMRVLKVRKKALSSSAIKPSDA